MSIKHTFAETRRTRRVLAVSLGLALALSLLLGLQAAKVAHAATPSFTVNSTGDENDLDFPGGAFDGSSDDTCDVDPAAGRQCTLRAAIQAANERAGADVIKFNIAGNGPHPISPGDELPTITRPVTINGYTQGDATATTADDATGNTLTQPGQTNANLKIVLHGAPATNYCYGLNVAANNVVIRGLVINNFEFCGSANSSSAPGIRLGGTGHRVEGNFIGTNASGTAPDRNARGVSLIEADGSTIGGTSPGDRNLISGNVHSGVEASDSSGNTIRNNLIGPDKNGQPLTDSNAVSGGVVISSGTGNRILSNSIYANGPLGIDLAGGGREQDPRDPDTGANNKQNFPVITSAQTFATFTSINGTLDSTPSTRKVKRTFSIQLFSNPSAEPDEGRTFLGQTQVTTNRQGLASFSFAPSQKVPVGSFITATATRNSTGDTSEFSQARVVEEPVIGP
jgi:CSLREA domain-containing protein